MLAVKSLALLAMTIAPLALATSVNETVLQDDNGADDNYWAQFCDDSGCSQGCGESVKVPNPGCLNESGRNSVLFHGGPSHDYTIVISPSADCPCQEMCAPVPPDATVCNS
ncbi:hypothetical protein M434DRAFT_397590 [Hypoxylon sp. CO27-5]|nr:hypothetical protein M434DRAFT_397590 [Hypoxylon sp. CO27-5]